MFRPPRSALNGIFNTFIFVTCICMRPSGRADSCPKTSTGSETILCNVPESLIWSPSPDRVTFFSGASPRPPVLR